MKKIFTFLFSIQSPLLFIVTLFCRGRYKGEDQFGNKYYTGKARPGYDHERRWVQYISGKGEASEVPPEFHGWLHHQTDVFPQKDKESFRRPWQKKHEPNLTGTSLAYRPAGHPLSSGQRKRATGDYEAWLPHKK